ncbi:MAG: ATP-binding cassette domain-containing protein [Melioribacteraceae bacterium]|nr:ATP-binding cassette domain-containing protein [Melioribacteraceae bacterium]MCF8264824.1 ATP-binding cassette domain-containing protein [Melioribacteraceae bacterium]MCF8432592.1 ATP-binding cassette domain-containing protein [Melioribacteraceae bacterium]
MKTKLVEFRNVDFSHSTFLSKGKKRILSNVNTCFYKNTTTGIIGESGSGKTTLIKLIAGVLKPTAGEIEYHNSVSEKQQIQILFQNNRHLINPVRKVSSILDDTQSLFKSRNGENFYSMILDKLQINERFLNKIGYQLSGGELQRVALARVLIAKPKLLILDEPFSAQDVYAQSKLEEILSFLKYELDVTLIIVSHNLEAVQDLVDDFYNLNEGRAAT